VITLASDFGTPYPAAMKGVLLQRSDARLVDVAHDFPRQDVRAAAFWLREVLPWFPPAVHLVVVDPGVGTDRAALVVRAGGHALVAPDNGVALPAARALAGRADDENGSGTGGENGAGRDGTEQVVEVFEVAYDDAAVESDTFHGRDVFAPAAADVHEAGIGDLETVERVAPAAEGAWTDLRFPVPEVRAGGATGEVLVVDGFGNAITNVPGPVLTDRAAVRVNGTERRVARAYAAVDPGEALVTVGSHGRVELAVNRGRGDERFGVTAGDRVELTWTRSAEN
jgi:hypothetical protein